jgi:biopolymer transport protein ExbD
MSRASRRRASEEDTELNMVPIMNMFMVLIPFLLMSASFIHIKAINTSVPVHASKTKSDAPEVSDIKVTVMLALGEKKLGVSATADGLSAAQLSEFEKDISLASGMEGAGDSLKGILKDIKTRYPKSDTVILVPDAAILYEQIIKTMDMARNSEEDDLFPNVVLSGSLG